MISFFKTNKKEILINIIIFLLFIIIFSFLKDKLNILISIYLVICATISFAVAKLNEITYVKVSLGLTKKEIIKGFFKEIIIYYIIFIVYLLFIYLFDFINREFESILYLDFLKNLLIMSICASIFSAVGILLPKIYKYIGLTIVILGLFAFIYFIYLA
ncbi:MAG: hypothetical protein J6W64_06925 [Bacilli bacterium]|nr:hypothetical protein [Bacilli bacterium]